jgi:hypothetical protein
VDVPLQSGAAGVGFAILFVECVDLGGGAGAFGDLAHLGQAAGGQAVALGVCLHQILLYESGVDRQDGRWVDLLVGLGQLVPGAVVVELEGMSQLPGQAGVGEGE